MQPGNEAKKETHEERKTNLSVFAASISSTLPSLLSLTPSVCVQHALIPLGLGLSREFTFPRSLLAANSLLETTTFCDYDSISPSFVTEAKRERERERERERIFKKEK